jgi:hypothetical protein
MIGNEVSTDSLGFFKDSEGDPSLSHVVGRIKPTLVAGNVHSARVSLASHSNCWICEGWSQVLFKWNPYKQRMSDGKFLSDKDINDKTFAYIHLSCDDYEPDLMEKNEETGEFTLLRMMPPL